MANKPQRKVNNRKTNKKGNPLTKRILSGIICLLSCLIILSLTVGYISIKDDLDNLKASGNIISWFKEGNSTTNNPVGIFGIVCGYIFIYLFGYWFSLIGFIIIAIVALHYFLTPESLKHRQKGYLLLIIMFFLQALIVSQQENYIHSVVPLFVYRILAAVFSGLGAKIILIGAMILTAIMLIE